ncbi:hypothetical protein Tco_1173972 [Tanacetum coccineum]
MSLYTHPSIPSDYDVKDAFSSTNAPNYTPTSPDYSRDFFPPEDISPPKDTETPVESPITVSPSSSVGSSSPVRSTTPPPDYPFDESIFAEMPPKRISTSEEPAINQAAIKKLVADSVSAALEAQAANMENTENTTRPREAHVARQCSYKEFMSFQRSITNNLIIQKMEDEFYHLIVNGNDPDICEKIPGIGNLMSPLLLPVMKKMEVYNAGLPRIIEEMLPPLNLKL